MSRGLELIVLPWCKQFTIVPVRETSSSHDLCTLQSRCRHRRSPGRRHQAYRRRQNCCVVCSDHLVVAEGGRLFGLHIGSRHAEGWDGICRHRRSAVDFALRRIGWVGCVDDAGHVRFHRYWAQAQPCVGLDLESAYACASLLPTQHRFRHFPRWPARQNVVWVFHGFPRRSHCRFDACAFARAVAVGLHSYRHLKCRSDASVLGRDFVKIHHCLVQQAASAFAFSQALRIG
jgi:hypothetical protein